MLCERIYRKFRVSAVDDPTDIYQQKNKKMKNKETENTNNY